MIIALFVPSFTMFGTYRTFLALMVVALHLGGVPKIGAYAVFGFYCLSGYLMTLIMQNNYGYTINGVGKYALNRFLRIYPIYWFSALFSLALIGYLGNDYTSGYHRAIYMPDDFLAIAKNVLLFFPFMETPRLTPPAWALTVEIFFYILIGLGISRNKRFTLAWFAISVLYHVGALAFQLGWTHRYFTVFAASLPFSSGALIFHYRSELTAHIQRLPENLLRYLPFILLFMILLNWSLGAALGQSAGFFFYSNYVLCAVMVAVLLDRRELPFINLGLDKWLGDFSYPIYLIHYQVGMVVMVGLAAMGFDFQRPSLILMTVSIPIIFLFSWAMTIILERPIELIRAKVKKG